MPANVYLYFIDEAGNTGRDLDNTEQPFHYLVALEVPTEKTLEIRHAVRDIAMSLFPQTSLNYSFEFHGYDLFAGDGAFKGIAPATRVDAYKKLVDIITYVIQRASKNARENSTGKSAATINALNNAIIAEPIP